MELGGEETKVASAVYSFQKCFRRKDQLEEDLTRDQELRKVVLFFFLNSVEGQFFLLKCFLIIVKTAQK